MKTETRISKRFRVTKRGKVLRRAMTLGHSRGNKSQRQIHRRRKMRGLDNAAEVKRYIQI